MVDPVMPRNNLSFRTRLGSAINVNYPRLEKENNICGVQAINRALCGWLQRSSWLEASVLPS